MIQVSTREGGLFGDTDEVTASGEEQANFDDLRGGGVFDAEQFVGNF